MKRPKRKQIVAAVMIVLLICILALGYARYNLLEGAWENDRDAEMKMEGIRLTMANLIEAQKQATSDYVEQLNDHVDLLAVPLREIVRRDGDEAIRNYEVGSVIRKDENEILFPQDDEGTLPSLTAIEYDGGVLRDLEISEPFVGKTGMFWTRMSSDPEGENILCVYRRLYWEYYYIFYTPESDAQTFIRSRADTTNVMENIENAYGCYFLGGYEEASDLHLFYGSDIFAEYIGGSQTASALGISLDREEKGFSPIKIGGTDYLYTVSDRISMPGFGNNARIIYVIPDNTHDSRVFGISIILLATVVIFLALATRVLSSIRLVRREIITESQRKLCGAGRTRMTAVFLGALGFAAVFCISIFVDTLSGLYYSTGNCNGALDTLFSMTDENTNREQTASRQREELYLGYAGQIAQLLSTYPDLGFSEQLSEMSASIGADYLMIFDDQGNEKLSDSRFVNLSYGTDETSSTYDFRRLILGVKSIVHDPCVDEVTGLERQLIGVSMEDDDISDGYASLILALIPEDGSSLLSREDMMQSLTYSGSMMIAVDKETHIIEESTDPELKGKNAVDLGMTAEKIHGEFMDFFTLGGTKWYGCSSEKDGLVYYYAIGLESVFFHVFRHGLLCGAMFLAAYAVLAIVLLVGYTEKNINDFGARVMDDRDEPILKIPDEPEGVWFLILLDRIRDWWVLKNPAQKAWYVSQGVTGVGLIALLFTALLDNGNRGEFSVIAYVFGNQWTYGFNLFALTKIAFIILGAVLLILLIRSLFGLLGGMVEKRGKTICRLLDSFLRYFMVIAALYFSLEALGFDTRALLASLGILSLALSLGSKDLVADLLSGITLVFSDEYQIGDIVEIGGFRGQVSEIGVRTTTLVDGKGGIKNINNQHVSNVLNLSRMNSVYSMQISVSSEQPLDDIETVLKQELPNIGSRIPEILVGPTYRGVTGFAPGGITLAVAADCREEDMPVVRAKLIAAIKRLLERYHFSATVQ